MSQFKNQIRATMALGILSIFAGIFGHLALTDIYHGEGDLTLEWRYFTGGSIHYFRICRVIFAGFEEGFEGNAIMPA
jgi:hypothetical protein